MAPSLTTLSVIFLVSFSGITFAKQYNCSELNGVWTVDSAQLQRDLENLSSYNINITNDKFTIILVNKNNESMDIKGRLICDVEDNVGRLFNWKYAKPFYFIKHNERFYGCDNSISYKASYCTQFIRK